ncbi:MAG: VCBS repeat-containing protein [Rhodospirillales bacterium]|nr:VCBS repeat-containing protein [Rhodospirillales bacterium]
MVLDTSLDPEFFSPPEGAENIELAQASSTGAEAIGKISALKGSVTITHTDGTKTQAADGAPIYQGDMVETADGGAVGITFADQSTFSLADAGSMTIDEMVYDPATQSGSSAVSVAEGLFTFVSGQIAKTGVDASTITTPVATIGIRGTSGGGQAAPEGQPNIISMFADASGGSGEIVINTQGGAQTLSTPNQTSQISSGFVPPTKPVVLPAATMAKFYAKAKAVAPQPPAGPTGDGDSAAATDAAPADGADGADGAPIDGAPADGDGNVAPDAALDAVEQAATDAFDQVLANGGSLGDALAAASDTAVETSIRTLLADNPEAFGSLESAAAIVQGMVGDVLNSVRGQVGDPFSAGTGSGTDSQPDGGFAQTFETLAEEQAQEFFEQFVDDPYADFAKEFLSPDDALFGDPFANLSDEPLPFFEPPPEDLPPPDDFLPPPLPPPDSVVVAASGTSTVSVAGHTPLGYTNAYQFDSLISTFVSQASQLADVDGDGDLDIIINGEAGAVGATLWDTYVGLNNGSGTFTFTSAIADKHTNNMELADLNGDGNLDMVLAETSATAQPVYFGDGAGGFTSSGQTLNFTTNGTNVALADLNGDGLKDIFVVSDSGNKVFLNTVGSAGTFTDTSQSLKTSNISYRSVTLGDIDGDGDIDAVTGSWGENINIWVNNGTGTFSNTGVTGTGTLGITGLSNVGSATTAATNDIVMGDLDGDGDLDIFAFNRYLGNQVFLNNGSGTFTDTGQVLGQYANGWDTRADGELVDIDGDGDLDAVAATENATEIFINDGKGNFNLLSLGVGTGWTNEVHIGDLNGDGVKDILVANSNNNPGGIILTAKALNTTGVAMGDLDGDGDLDAFTVNQNQANGTWINDGTGAFGASTQSLGTANSTDVVLGDVDLDGDLDAVVSNSGGANKVWLNNGTGTFTDSAQSLGTNDSTGIALADLNNDGTLDMVVSNSSGQGNTVYLNTSGTFTDTTQSLGTSNSTDVALGDLDGDGKIDAFVTNTGQANSIWKNDGAGTFTNSSNTTATLLSNAVALGDIDGDGDLDAFVANTGANEVYLNDGTGAFTDSAQSLGASDTQGVSLVDIDGDGDLDAFTVNASGGNTIWLNDGGGVFTDSGVTMTGTGVTDIATADMDGDGDKDFFTSVNGSNQVWYNTTGDQTLNGGAGDDFLTGGAKSDTFNAGAGADIIIGGAGRDTINAGSGADVVTGEGGADTINLGFADGSADIVQYTAFTDGSTDLTLASADKINQFEAGTDKIEIVDVGIGLNGTGVASVTSGTANLGATNGVFYINNATAQNLDSLTNISAAIGALTGEGAGGKAIFVVQNTAGTQSGIYAFTDDGGADGTIVAAELDLLAAVDTIITDADVAVV